MYRNYTRSQLLEFRVSLLYNDISKETYIRYVYRYISKETYITIVAIDPDRGAVGPICSEDRGPRAQREGLGGRVCSTCSSGTLPLVS